MKAKDESSNTALVGRPAVSARNDTRAHYLVVVEGHEPGHAVYLGDAAVHIGRAEPCEMVIPDQGISRCHCRIENRFGEIVVTDLGSTNGTFVDGRPVSGSIILLVDSLLQIGEQVLRHEYRVRSEVEASQALDRDLHKARQYVLSQLPAPWRTGPVTTEWIVLPSTRLGGDALGYHELDKDRYALYLVDVSGHGARAALHTVSVMNVLRHHSLPRADFSQPAQVLQGLNAMFDMDEHAGMYFTIWYGIYDAQRRTLRYASGGHHPAFLVPPGRGEAVPLHTRNVAIGTAPEYPYKSEDVQVPSGSALYLFSDGVFEIVTTAGAEWRLQEFVPMILQPPSPDLSEPERLLAAVRREAQREAFDDDFSMLVATFP